MKCETCNGTGSKKDGSNVSLACPTCKGTGTTGNAKAATKKSDDAASELPAS
jgi:DnaJ-class molecular chaperone